MIWFALPRYTRERTMRLMRSMGIASRDDNCVPYVCALLSFGRWFSCNHIYRSLRLRGIFIARFLRLISISSRMLVTQGQVCVEANDCRPRRAVLVVLVCSCVVSDPVLSRRGGHCRPAGVCHRQVWGAVRKVSSVNGSCVGLGLVIGCC